MNPPPPNDCLQIDPSKLRTCLTGHSLDTPQGSTIASGDSDHFAPVQTRGSDRHVDDVMILSDSAQTDGAIRLRGRPVNTEADQLTEMEQIHAERRASGDRGKNTGFRGAAKGLTHHGGFWMISPDQQLQGKQLVTT